MKPRKLVMMLCLISPSIALGQFNSGSTGADGPLNVTSNMTLNLPTNGIFNCTTITILNGATLSFSKNPLNTPVYLLATGDVIINGTIDVSGSASSAGPGGFDGGFGSIHGTPNGDGFGPGGGKNDPLGPGSPTMAGVFAFVSPSNGSSGGNSNIYGNTLLSPLIGGSGGGAAGGNWGGGGGGAILIASTTSITVNDTVKSTGGGGYFGSGSGGAIRIVAPTVSGTGNLSVPGGGLGSGSGYGTAGRTRIDCLDRIAWRNLNLQNAGKWTVGAQMFVFPPGNPKLDIINAAGTAIPEGTNAPVVVTLPVGSSTNQIVRVQARGFTNDVSIRVKITPENAPSATFDGTILQSSGNPPVGEVNVTIPVDVVSHIHVWTR